MATTETVHKLLIGGEWYETGETIDVTSPYDGSVVGRVAYGGAEDARRAIDAAEQAMRTPIPAHQRAAVLDGVAELLRERRDEFARTIAEEAGKPLTTAGMEVDRAVQTMIFSALEARRLTGETVPMDAHPAGEGHAGLILRMPIGIVAAISPFNFPLNLVAHKVGPGVRRRLRGRAQARRRDAAVRAAAGAGVRGRRPARRLAERDRRQVARHRRRADRGRARPDDHLHRLVRGRLGHPRPSEQEEGVARARQLDAADRAGRRRPGQGGGGDRGPRLLVRRAELHLDPARVRRGLGARRADGEADAEGRGAQGRRPAGRRHAGRPGDRPREPRPDQGVGRRRGRRAAPRSSPAARSTTPACFTRCCWTMSRWR